MNIEDFIPQGEQKMRIVQELVPGKQVTLAHVIASPDPIIYRKLGLIRNWIITGLPSAS